MTARTTPEYPVERTIFFSDAVIAIAMTLLAIELPLPTGTTGTQVWHSFVENLSGDYLAFLISFAVIGRFWFQHHQFFERVERLNGRLIMMNLVNLIAVVLVPFATKMLNGFGELPFGPIFYACVMLFWGAGYLLMVRAASQGRLWRPDLPEGGPRRMVVGASTALAPFALSIPVAFARPGLAPYCWLLIPVAAAVLGRRRASRGAALRPAA